MLLCKLEKIFPPGTDGLDYHGRVEEIYELSFHGDKPLKPIMFKCHWFNPRSTRQTPHLGLVEIREDSIYPRNDVYIVAQQAVQVYYTRYANQDKEDLKGWAIVHQVSPHGKLPAPNDDDYNFNANTYDGQFYQEDGLPGTFEIVLPEAIEMEVDNEMVDGEVDGDVVVNAKDIAMLERLLLGNDDDDNIEPSDSVAHLDNFDSDDETYDPNHEDYS